MSRDESIVTDRVNPQSGTTQTAIAALWAEVLDKPLPPAADDNFFDLGGDSIAMITLLYRIQEEFSVELPSGAVFSAPSVRELAALVESTCATSVDPEHEPQQTKTER